MKSRAILAALLLSGLVLVQPALAQDYLFDTGRTYFEYTEYPTGPYEGIFEAQGAIDPSDPDFPDGAEGCYGVVVDVGGIYTLLSVAGFYNPDGSIDGVLLFISSHAPLAPGDYFFDPVGFTVGMAFVDDAVNVTFPDDPFSLDWEAWLATIDAAHIFVSTSGYITIDAINAEEAYGTFQGLMVDDLGNGIQAQMSNGQWEVGHTSVATESSSWSEVKALY
ncbi:MAG: hypothetical protein R3C71_12455 [Candidatus Krumholzibacteriia bacterium]|nr:hypothetical protein [bacterium]MCB9512821.1 hypothetical protein [Candidatus Latescibacterota bacterium]MCB9516906.1 hypothetical protein [Candidatus Latescibacterota bacterium]